ncbi:MAG: alpha-amylase, partial [Treponema sp.]|nr:alpha-amylase [Treponema sp.]
ILNDAEDSALAFYKKAAEFAKDSGKKAAAPEKQYALYKARVKKLVTIHNAKEPKKPEDLQKALEKAMGSKEKAWQNFAKLMIQAIPPMGFALQCWAMCAEYADNGLADAWNLGRKANQAAKKQLKDLVRKTIFLAKYADSKEVTPATSKTAKPAQKNHQIYANTLVTLLVNSRYDRILGGTNTFDNIKWFNKEVLESNLNTIFMLLTLNASAKQMPEAVKLYKKICAEKVKAAYKCDLFEAAFPLPKVKEPAKKKAKAKKATEPKKAAAKKTTTKSVKKTAQKKTIN